MLGLLGFMFGASASVVMLVLGRWAASASFGGRRLRDALAPWAKGGGSGRPIACAGGGIVGWYLGAAIAIALGMMIAGTTAYDETSMRVRVSPGGPAARAGIRDGDRIVAVEGEPINHWDQLQTIIGKRPGEVTRLTVERAGAQTAVIVVPEAKPGDRARILVGPYAETRSIGAGEALGIGLVEPFVVVKSTAKSVVRIFTGRERAEMTGPVGIVQEVSKTGGIAIGMKLAGAIMSYVWPAISLVSLCLAFIRRRAPA